MTKTPLQHLANYPQLAAGAYANLSVNSNKILAIAIQNFPGKGPL